MLAAVPLVESGYSNRDAPDSDEPSSGAPGSIPGRGLWMFIPATARTYGLQVDDTVDQRFDEAMETEAAGARELSPLQVRGWGDEAAYSQDPDGHVIAFARRL